MVKVIIIVVKTNRQTLKNRRGKLRRLHPPLFDGIALEERLIELFADKTQSLFFKGLRFQDRTVPFFGNKRPGLIWRTGLRKKLVDGMQVDRQREHLAIHGCFDTVHIRHHLSVLSHIIPHCFIIGVKDMRAINVNHNVGLRIARIIGVTAYVVTLVNNSDVMTLFSELACDNHTGKTRSDDENIFTVHNITPAALTKN